jgi:hypothetical protein
MEENPQKSNPLKESLQTSMILYGADVSSTNLSGAGSSFVPAN